LSSPPPNIRGKMKWGTGIFNGPGGSGRTGGGVGGGDIGSHDQARRELLGSSSAPGESPPAVRAPRPRPPPSRGEDPECAARNPEVADYRLKDLGALRRIKEALGETTSGTCWAMFGPASLSDLPWRVLQPPVWSFRACDWLIVTDDPARVADKLIFLRETDSGRHPVVCLAQLGTLFLIHEDDATDDLLGLLLPPPLSPASA